MTCVVQTTSQFHRTVQKELLVVSTSFSHSSWYLRSQIFRALILQQNVSELDSAQAALPFITTHSMMSQKAMSCWTGSASSPVYVTCINALILSRGLALLRFMLLVLRLVSLSCLSAGYESSLQQILENRKIANRRLQCRHPSHQQRAEGMSCQRRCFEHAGHCSFDAYAARRSSVFAGRRLIKRSLRVTNWTTGS